jgi:hypothetical protein
MHKTKTYQNTHSLLGINREIVGSILFFLFLNPPNAQEEESLLFILEKLSNIKQKEN